MSSVLWLVLCVNVDVTTSSVFKLIWCRNKDSKEVISLFEKLTVLLLYRTIWSNWSSVIWWSSRPWPTTVFWPLTVRLTIYNLTDGREDNDVDLLIGQCLPPIQSLYGVSLTPSELLLRYDRRHVWVVEHQSPQESGPLLASLQVVVVWSISSVFYE